MNSPPISQILPLGSNEILLNNWIQFLDYTKDIPTKYAVTFTLIPAEWEELKSHPQEIQLDYLTQKLSQYYSNFIFISELTKKKVVHLHGVVCDFQNVLEKELIKYTINKNRKFDVRYKDQRYANKNVIKKLYTTKQVNAWIKYMKKEMQPISILQYFYPNDYQS